MQALRAVIVCLCHDFEFGQRMSWKETVRRIEGLSSLACRDLCGGGFGGEEEVVRKGQAASFFFF